MKLDCLELSHFNFRMYSKNRRAVYNQLNEPRVQIPRSAHHLQSDQSLLFAQRARALTYAVSSQQSSEFTAKLWSYWVDQADLSLHYSLMLFCWFYNTLAQMDIVVRNLNLLLANNKCTYPACTSVHSDKGLCY